MVSVVVLLWAGGARAPQYLAHTIVKVGIGPPKYLRQKGPRMILEAWAPQYQKHDYTPTLQLLTSSEMVGLGVMHVDLVSMSQ